MALPEADGPCTPWCTWDQVAACVQVDLSDITDPAQQDDLIAQAGEIMWNLSRRRYPGECTTTRSVCRECVCGQRRCCCVVRDRVDLGAVWPVGEILSVVIDGVEIDPVDYSVSGYRWLVNDAGDNWPHCSDLDSPDGFVVTYTYGALVPVGGQLAAAALAAEAASYCVTGECQIPQHVTTVAREGVTYTILDSLRIFTEGRTGVAVADMWLGSLEKGRAARAGIFDPLAGCTRLGRPQTGNAGVS